MAQNCVSQILSSSGSRTILKTTYEDSSKYL